MYSYSGKVKGVSIKTTECSVVTLIVAASGAATTIALPLSINDLSRKGIIFVRSSRVAQGIVFNDEIFDPNQYCIPANTLTPQKARVLLMLALSQTRDREEIKAIFKETLNLDLGDGHFRQMPYAEAMSRFGSDKPDTRFGLELQDVSDIAKKVDFKVFSDALAIDGIIKGSVRAINAKGFASKLSRKDIDGLVEYVKTLGAKGLAWLSYPEGGEIKGSFLKFLTEENVKEFSERLNFEEGDVLFFAADKDYVVCNTLGGLRLHLAEKYNLIDKNK